MRPNKPNLHIDKPSNKSFMYFAIIFRKSIVVIKPTCWAWNRHVWMDSRASACISSVAAFAQTSNRPTNWRCCRTSACKHDCESSLEKWIGGRNYKKGKPSFKQFSWSFKESNFTHFAMLEENSLVEWRKARYQGKNSKPNTLKLRPI